MKYRLIKKLTPVLQRLYRFYLKKPRKFRYGSIRVKIEPGVFYPGFVSSTGILLDFISQFDLKGKKVLDAGTGCGILAILAAKKGADVTALDINPDAVKNATENAEKNKTEIRVVLSDLFENLESRHFDYIFLNPPYYSKEPRNYSEMAWYCGVHHNYFEKLFSQLMWKLAISDEIFMILSTDCNVQKITEIAGQYGFSPDKVLTRKRCGEEFSVYQLTSRLPGLISIN